jgi:AraC family transcriptional regulator
MIAHMKVNGIGRVIFWGGGNLWIGRAVDQSELHAHHAIQIAIGFNGPVQFRPGPRADWAEYPKGALVRPGAPHEFRAPGQRIANILYEPETPLGRALLERHPGAPVIPLDAKVEELSAAFESGASDDVLAQLSMDLIARLAGTSQPQRTTDKRIIAAITWIADHIERPLSLAEAAAVAELSESRFRHLFVEETGIAFRAYVLWTRLNRALELGFSGASWTEAAHATNFADSAHLTRTCRRMYGLVPTSLRIEAVSGTAAKTA